MTSATKEAGAAGVGAAFEMKPRLGPAGYCACACPVGLCAVGFTWEVQAAGGTWDLAVVSLLEQSTPFSPTEPPHKQCKRARLQYHVLL